MILKSTKILFVINNIEFLYSHRLPIILGAVDAGYEVHVATYYKLGMLLQHQDKLTYHHIDFNRNSINPITELKPLIQLAKLYRRLSPDIVHHTCKKSVLYGCLVTRFMPKIAVLNTIPGLGYLFISQKLKASIVRAVLQVGYRIGLHRKCLQVAFQNEDDQALFLKHRLVKSDQCLLIRGSGVDIDAYKPVIKLQDVPPIIVLPARLLWDKGVGEFVEAARQLKAQCDARFVLIGDVDPINPASIPANTLKQWVDEGVIEHWGWCDDMVPIFEQAHIACLPSYREGMPKALLEALAAGLPVVTTNAPGCKDTVEKDKNGFVVPIKQFESLAAALRKLIENQELRLEMGKASRARAITLFSTHIIIEQHLKVYRNLLI